MFPKTRGLFLGVPRDSEYNILESMLESPDLVNLGNRGYHTTLSSYWLFAYCGWLLLR